MATPFVTPGTPDAVNLVKMVRDYSVILSDTNTFSNAKLLDYLNQHAFPRIRGRLLTARRENSQHEGQHLFYEDITKLADPAIQAQASELVRRVMTDPSSIVKDYVFRIAAAFAASWALSALVAQLDQQRDMAKHIEKEAMSDLQDLVRSPELQAAVAQVQAQQKAHAEPVPKIYIALDVDPSTYNAATNSVRTFTGAQEAGIARLWIGPEQVNAPVDVGDTPIMIMTKLLGAVRAYQMMNPPPGAKFNLVLGPNEGPMSSGVRTIEITNALGQTTSVMANVSTNIGWLSFHAYQYDPAVDALFCTLELIKSSDLTLGIPGIVYGTLEDTIDYSRLSQKGPYSVFLDVAQAKGAQAAVIQQDQIKKLSDAFYFRVSTPDGLTAEDAQLRYQIQNLVAVNLTLPPEASQPRTLLIPAGSSALDVAIAIARDMEKIAPYNKVLGALRSPTQILVQGSPVTAPGLQIVPYRPSGTEDKIVMDILEVPADVEFGVLPRELITNGAFDNQPKSLVLDIQFFTALADKGIDPSAVLLGQGRTMLVEPVISNRIAQAFGDIGYLNRGIL